MRLPAPGTALPAGGRGHLKARSLALEHGRRARGRIVGQRVLALDDGAVVDQVKSVAVHGSKVLCRSSNLISPKRSAPGASAISAMREEAKSEIVIWPWYPSGLIL